MFKFNNINTGKTYMMSPYYVSILIKVSNYNCKHIFAFWVFRLSTNFPVIAANFVVDKLRVHCALVLSATQNDSKTTPLHSKKCCRSILKCILKSVNNTGWKEEADSLCFHFHFMVFNAFQWKSLFFCMHNKIFFSSAIFGYFWYLFLLQLTPSYVFPGGSSCSVPSWNKIYLPSENIGTLFATNSTQVLATESIFSKKTELGISWVLSTEFNKILWNIFLCIT